MPKKNPKQMLQWPKNLKSLFFSTYSSTWPCRFAVGNKNGQFRFVLLWTNWHEIMRQLDLSLLKISQYKVGGKLLYLNHTLLLFRRPNIQGYNSTEECLCWNLWPRRRWTGRKTCKYSKLKKLFIPKNSVEIFWPKFMAFYDILFELLEYCLRNIAPFLLLNTLSHH